MACQSRCLTTIVIIIVSINCIYANSACTMSEDAQKKMQDCTTRGQKEIMDIGKSAQDGQAAGDVEKAKTIYANIFIARSKLEQCQFQALVDSGCAEKLSSDEDAIKQLASQQAAVCETEQGKSNPLCNSGTPQERVDIVKGQLCTAQVDETCRNEYFTDCYTAAKETIKWEDIFKKSQGQQLQMLMVSGHQ